MRVTGSLRVTKSEECQSQPDCCYLTAAIPNHACTHSSGLKLALAPRFAHITGYHVLQCCNRCAAFCILSAGPQCMVLSASFERESCCILCGGQRIEACCILRTGRMRSGALAATLVALWHVVLQYSFLSFSHRTASGVIRRSHRLCDLI